MKRYLLIYQGRVQGVGFRYQCQALALQYHLTGYAHNLENGNVQVEIQGEEENINQFLIALHKGNRFIRIDDYSMREIEVIAETKFTVR